jgi:hypothetical protein
MKFKVFSLLTCKDCSAYHKVITEFCSERKIDLDIIDVDDPDNLEANILAMIEYRLQDIPSTVLIDSNGFAVKMRGKILTRSDLEEMLPLYFK